MSGDVGYYTNEGFYRHADASYEVAQVTRDEPGYTVAALWPTITEAEAHVAQLNAAAGLSASEAMDIVVSSMAVTHRWQYGRLTGAKTCERCGLLPLDDDDIASRCPGTRDRTH